MIAVKAHFYFKVINLLLHGQVVSPSVIKKDYDRLSRSYDCYFTTHIAEHSRNLIARMGLEEGSNALDLACGTGTLTVALADSVGERGEVIGVDHSPGMLSVARAKANRHCLQHIRFLEADMRDTLHTVPDNVFDAVTCGWAIGYTDPGRMMETIWRKLKSGGKVGLIENTHNTLLPIRRTCMRVAQTFPQHMEQIMDLHFRLPKGGRHLERLFRVAGLRPLEVWEGQEKFEFRSGSDVLYWVLHTGASAGFDRMMASKVREQCDELFIRYIEEDFMKNERITITHRYVAGIARKEF